MPGKLVRRHGRGAVGAAAARPDWLALTREEILEPALPIIDAHHHLYDREVNSYMFDELLADVQSGHNIRATVFIDAGSMHNKDVPPKMAPLGEVEFINGIAAMSASGDYGPTRLCAAIMGYADLTMGAEVEELLDAQMATAPRRFRGIRVSAALDVAAPKGGFNTPAHLLLDADFRAGFVKLAERKLAFEAWAYHPQLADIVDLARAFPDTTIIVNHTGGLIADTPPHSDRRDETIAFWKARMAELARCPNVFLKLGGRGILYMGYGYNKLAAPPGSERLAADWRPIFETCIELFGAGRCMFESNFPPDKLSFSYPVLWNAFKRLATGYSAAEKHDLFYGAAARAYRIALD